MGKNAREEASHGHSLILWKEISVLITDGSTRTPFSPQTIEVPAKAQFGTATGINRTVPLTAGRLSPVHVIRFLSINPGVVPRIALHPEQWVLTHQEGADAP